jgi:hypothetical protein
MGFGGTVVHFSCFFSTPRTKLHCSNSAPDFELLP